ncbi:kisspeptin receptor 1 [Saccoglossus kowalevskii]|uniref:Kisspeptin receptor 1 n=1 Tax=Saccoglossus kowalevskii TaxID=10224 RepID=D1LX50_SACKO|nr:kisspeptin receptor 1 [Saccoglossus kowalevskii]ACY92556.1 kisspeptin receptor 1 [Saccoglossus kowalevskii]
MADSDSDVDYVDSNASYNYSYSYSWYSYSYPDYEYKLGPESVVVPAVWGIFSLLGLIGNIFIVIVVFKYSHMRTVTNYYIVNLACTDIAVLLLCVPFTSSVYAFHTAWVFGDAMCRFVAWTQLASWQATCLTLTVISADRYYAIVYPIRSIKYRTPRAAVLINISIWIFSYTITTPTLYLYRVEVYAFDRDHAFCIEYFASDSKANFNTVYVTVYALLSYFLPLVVIFVCYMLMIVRLWRTSGPTEDAIMSEQAVRQKKKITRMVLVVVILYAVCHLPNHVLNLLFRWNYEVFADPDNKMLLKVVRILAHTLVYFNSIINPIVYNVLGDNFRKSLKKAFLHNFRKNKIMDSHTMNTVNGNGTHTMNVTHSNKVHPSSSNSRSEN